MSDAPGRSTLSEAGPGRGGPADPTLTARLLAEQRDGWRAGNPVAVEALIARFDALRGDDEAVLQLIFHEIVLREERGEDPRLEEFQLRFPHLAGPLKLQFSLDRALRSRLFAPSTIDASGPPPGPARQAPLPAVPGYETTAELGRGGMGVVYQAWQNSLGRFVALKMLRERAEVRPVDLARFRTEAEAVARLQHPHIVQIYEIGEFDGRPYLALEFCDGGSLADRLDGTPVPRAAAAAVVETVARAMHYAHQRGIVHRDLKPANILVAECGPRNAESKLEFDSALVKVTDFGLAKAIGSGHGQTASGAILGTPSYMAPEQAAGGSKDIGPSADVYALGAVLYECLTGRPPFRAATPMETLLQVQRDEPVRARHLNPTVPRDLETICHKCLQKDAHKRYPSALDLAEDLNRFRAGRPILARPVGPAARAARWCRRNPALAATGAVALVSLLAGTAVSVGFGVVQFRTARTLRAEQRETERLTASLSADRGSALGEQRALAEGLLWFARSYESADRAGDEALCGAARANLAHWGVRLHELRAVLEHPGPVRAVVVTPGGTAVVTGCEDGLVRFWDASTGDPLGEPIRLPAAVRTVANAAGGRIVTGSADGTARLWDAAGRAPAGPPLPHADALLAVAAAPTGTTVVTGTAGGVAQAWDAATGQRVGPPVRHAGEVRAVAIFPDGRTALSAGTDGFTRTWRIGTGEQAGPDMTQSDAVTGAALSADGRWVVTGNDNWDVDLWAAASGRRVERLPFNRGQVTAVAVDRAGERVLVGCADAGTAHLLAAERRGSPWPLVYGLLRAATARLEPPSGRPIARLDPKFFPGALGPPLPHDGPVAAAAFGRDGRLAVTGSVDGTARVWALAPDLDRPTVFRHARCVRAVAFSPDGRTVATGGEDRVARIWDAASSRPVAAACVHGVPVWAVAFRPDGQAVLTLAADNRVRTWDAATGRLISDVPLAAKAGRAAAFSPDGLLLLAATGDGAAARIWDTTTGQPITGALTHDGPVYCVGFGPDGRHAITGSTDGTARVWDLTGQPVGRPLRHKGQILAVALSPDGRAALTGGKDNTARIWDVETGEPLGPPLAHPLEVWGAAFSPDGRLAATCCHDGQARLWWVAAGKPVGPPLPSEIQLLGAAFRADGRALLTACWDGTASLWQLPAIRKDDPERSRLWAETATGMVLDPTGGIRLSNPADWRDRRRRLERLVGPPAADSGPP
jgi:WD40 repeat protein